MPEGAQKQKLTTHANPPPEWTAKKSHIAIQIGRHEQRSLYRVSEHWFHLRWGIRPNGWNKSCRIEFRLTREAFVEEGMNKNRPLLSWLLIFSVLISPPLDALKECGSWILFSNPHALHIIVLPPGNVHHNLQRRSLMNIPKKKEKAKGNIAAMMRTTKQQQHKGKQQRKKLQNPSKKH